MIREGPIKDDVIVYGAKVYVVALKTYEETVLYYESP